MDDIHIPIDASLVGQILPPGAKVLYSTIASPGFATGATLTFWKAHMLVTDQGIAFTKPKGNTGELQNVYIPWHDIRELHFMKRMRHEILTIKHPNYNINLDHLSKDEPLEMVNQRSREFIPKFLPVMIARKQDYLAANKDKPEADKKYLSMVEKTLKSAQKQLQKLK